MTRILVVDDHAGIRLGLRQLLSEQPGFVVCGDAESAEDAIEAVRMLRPDLVITDVSMGGMSGLDLVREIARFDAALPIVVYSMHHDPILVELAFAAGARGYVSKRDPANLLLHAIQEVLNGGRYPSAW